MTGQQVVYPLVRVRVELIGSDGTPYTWVIDGTKDVVQLSLVQTAEDDYTFALQLRARNATKYPGHGGGTGHAAIPRALRPGAKPNRMISLVE